MTNIKKGLLILLALILLFTGCTSGGGGNDNIIVVVDTISFAASRTSGVAPLAIFFNAELTPSTSILRDFHDNEYTWDFDDMTAGTWADGKDKNVALGAVASHVFETPGDYTVTVTVRNRDAFGDIQVVDTGTLDITVTDPDTVFSGTNTICISDVANNDFAEKPTGALEVTTDDLETALEAHVAVGNRVLLHRGSSWTTSRNISFPSGVYVSAYGTGTNENSYGIFDNAPHITVGGTATNFLYLSYQQDLRIVGLRLTAPKVDGVSGFVGATDMDNNLMLRLDIEGFNYPIMWSHWRHNDTETVKNMFVVSCQLKEARSMAFYGGAENFTFIGNEAGPADLSHVTRVWWTWKGVYQHNYVSGSSVANTNGRHALKFHGPKLSFVGDYDTTAGSGLPEFTRFCIVSDNVFGASGPWPVSIGPTNANVDERLQDVIFERNRYAVQYGTANPVDVSVAVSLSGQYHTIRNNVIDLTGCGNGAIGITVRKRGVEWDVKGTEIYNNTVYRGNDAGDSTNSHVGISVGASASDIIVTNNLISFPFTVGSDTLIEDDSGLATVNSNVLTDEPFFTDPENVTALERDFSLTGNSVMAIDLGDIAPVLDDVSGGGRGGDFDIGAYSY